MIATARLTKDAHQHDHNEELFLAMLPKVRRHAAYFFSRQPREHRDESVAAAVALAFSMFRRLLDRRKAHLAYPFPLAMYACRQVLAGRSLGARWSVRDVMSRHCQRRKAVRVERLDHFDEEQGGWREVLVEDRRSNPADIAAARIDIPAFFAQLSARDRQVAESLASGESTSNVAKRYRVSAGRISQLRRELHNKWRRFHGEAVS